MSILDRPGHISRRAFVGRVLRLGSIGAAASGLTWLYHDRPPSSRVATRTIRDHRVASQGPKMAVASGPSPAENVRALLAALGGIDRFVQKGQIVLIKPNAAWDRIPEQAADTNPDVVAELVRLAIGAGAKEVIVADVTCNDARRSFTRSGIEEAARKAGATVAYPPLPFVKVQLGGKLLGEWDVFEPLVRADCVINVPAVKTHGHAKSTIGMKNWYGVLGSRRMLLHQQIDQSIVELAQAIRPTLTVVDATRVLMRNGPQGGSLSDVKRVDAVAGGTDPVALDAWGTELLDLSPDKVPYLALAQARGLGVVNWKSLAPREIAVQRLARG